MYQVICFYGHGLLEERKDPNYSWNHNREDPSISFQAANHVQENVGREREAFQAFSLEKYFVHKITYIQDFSQNYEC